jgi:hypothetical protein
LNSVTVPVDASGYQGAWGLSAYMPALTTGSRTFTLVPGIAYSLDAGSFVAGSAFTFTVTATGQVAAISPAAAAAGGATLKFNLANVTIDPGKYTASYAVFSHALVAGIRTFSLLKDLVFGIDNGSYLAGSTIYVKLGPTGLVASEITPAGAASGNGSTLSFANVQVAVDPHAYAGAYSVGSYAPAAGLATFFLVPGLVSHLSAQGQAAPFTPSAAQVTPSSITLSAGTFGFSPVTAATAPRFAALVAAQIAAYVAAGQIDPAAGAFLSLLFSTAAGMAATQPAVARALLGAFVLATNLGAAAGLISPAAQSALVRDAQALLSILP